MTEYPAEAIKATEAIIRDTGKFFGLYLCVFILGRNFLLKIE